MRCKATVLGLGMAFSTAVFPQAPAAPAAEFVPQLLPGEGLAVATPDGEVRLFGEAKKETPMGSLAKLAWLRLEGEDWLAMDVSYRCSGHDGTDKCWLAQGHGKVNLAKATQDSCNLAYLSWARAAAERWKKDIGEDAARVRLEDVFNPFLGNRLAPGEKVPSFTLAWVGDGDLLRTSPEAMARWLADPGQEQLLSMCQRLLLGFFGTFKPTTSWWMKTGTACVPSDPSITSAWVAGSNGQVIAVLHLPKGRGKVEGLARFRAVMGIQDKP
jgi:hypothetical protein